MSQFFNDSDGIAVILSLDIGDNIKLRPSDGLGGRTTSSEVVAGAVLQRQSVSAKKLVDVYSRISCGGTSGGSSACGDFCGHESCGGTCNNSTETWWCDCGQWGDPDSDPCQQQDPIGQNSGIPCSTITPEGYTEIDGGCYYQSDLDVLQQFIDNSQGGENPPPSDLSPIELGYQVWEDGRLVYFCCNGSSILYQECIMEYTLSGNIPYDIGNLTSLTYLGLYDNQLTGEIPPEIGNLTNLTYLVLGENQLSGEIPPEIWNLTNLELMGLHQNQLTGEISPEIGQLTNLDTLALSTNQLTGEIPVEIWHLPSMQLLVLEHNQLTGEISPEMSDFPGIYITLKWNQLSGVIPEVTCDLGSSGIWMQYNKLCPPYPECFADPLNNVSPETQDTSECDTTMVGPSKGKIMGQPYGIADHIRKVSDPYEGALAYINDYSERISRSTRNTKGGGGSGYESQPGYIFYDENPQDMVSDFFWDPVLIDENYEVFHEWPNFNVGNSQFPIGQPKYGTSVLPNLHLNHASTGTGVMGGGAGVARTDETGNTLWTAAESTYISQLKYYNGGNIHMHHAKYPLPNGNILMHGDHDISQAEAIALGKDPDYFTTWNKTHFESGVIIEVDFGEDGHGTVVWEWYMYDHFIQDRDPSHPSCSEFPDVPSCYVPPDEMYRWPHKIDINMPQETSTTMNISDWAHFNTGHYTPYDNGQFVSTGGFCPYVDGCILISSRSLGDGEMYIIEKGEGRIIYRCCNPQNYHRGGEKDRLNGRQHGGNWIPIGYPGEGDIIFFNNDHLHIPCSDILDEETCNKCSPGGHDASGTPSQQCVWNGLFCEMGPPSPNAGYCSNSAVVQFTPNYHIEIDSHVPWQYDNLQVMDHVFPCDGCSIDGGPGYLNNNKFYARAEGGVFKMPNGNVFVSLATRMDPQFEVANPFEDPTLVQVLRAGTGSESTTQVGNSQGRNMKYIPGCTDPTAANYDPAALYMYMIDDGSCHWDFPTGDINLDAIVNVQDAVILVEMIMYHAGIFGDGKLPYQFCGTPIGGLPMFCQTDSDCTIFGGGICITEYAHYDVNSDNWIDIGDAISIINIVLAEDKNADTRKLQELLNRLQNL